MRWRRNTGLSVELRKRSAAELRVLRATMDPDEYRAFLKMRRFVKTKARAAGDRMREKLARQVFDAYMEQEAGA